ncbi:MAG: hypothetical protein EB023_12310, partial [Flavobacteriia bacterium]|nr:hypothetical protein [Flavobacteriia bacterium]
MKKSILLSISVTFSVIISVQGQTKLTGAQKTNYMRNLNKGIELFEAERSYDALESFKKAEALDAEDWKLNYWMAACHYDLNAYYVAEQYIGNAKKKFVEGKEGDAAFYELEGKVYHRLGQIENAVSAYKKTAILMGDKAAKEFGINMYIAQCEMVLSDRKQGIQLSRKPLSKKINTVEDEYAPILSKGNEFLFFTARRPETTGENLNPDDLRYFEDMYKANWNATT